MSSIHKKACQSNYKKQTLGIPETLRKARLEKISETVPVKLWPSLAKYVRENGGSKLIREALVAYLEEA